MKTTQILLILLLFITISSKAQLYIDTPTIVKPLEANSIYSASNFLNFNGKLLITGAKDFSNRNSLRLCLFDGNTVTFSNDSNKNGGYIAHSFYSNPNIVTTLNQELYYGGYTYAQKRFHLYKWDGKNTPQQLIGNGDTLNFPTGLFYNNNNIYFFADRGTPAPGKHRSLFAYDISNKQSSNPLKGISDNHTVTDGLHSYKGKFIYIASDDISAITKFALIAYEPSTNKSNVIMDTIKNTLYGNLQVYGSKAYFTSEPFDTGAQHKRYLISYDGIQLDTLAENIKSNGYTTGSPLTIRNTITHIGRIYFWATSINNGNRQYQLSYLDTNTKQVIAAPGNIITNHNLTLFLKSNKNYLYYREGNMLVRYNGSNADTMLPFDFSPISMGDIDDKLYVCGRYQRTQEYRIYTMSDKLVEYFTPDTSNNNEPQLKVQLYPNPTTDQLNIVINNNEDQNINANILDRNGSVVISYPDIYIPKGNKTISISTGHLSRGNYLIRLYVKNKVILTESFIKN